MGPRRRRRPGRDRPGARCGRTWARSRPRWPAPHRPAEGRPVPGLLDVTLPWTTLAGQSQAPGLLGRIGPITAGQARHLAAAAETDPAVPWRVIVTNPAGQAIAVSRIRRRTGPGPPCRDGPGHGLRRPHHRDHRPEHDHHRPVSRRRARPTHQDHRGRAAGRHRSARPGHGPSPGRPGRRRLRPQPANHRPTGHHRDCGSTSSPGMSPAASPPAASPPGAPTWTTPILTTSTAAPAAATSAAPAAATTSSNSTPAGNSNRPSPATSPGPHPPDAPIRPAPTPTPHEPSEAWRRAGSYRTERAAFALSCIRALIQTPGQRTVRRARSPHIWRGPRRFRLAARLVRPEPESRGADLALRGP